MCDCMVDSDGSRSNLSLVLGILHVCGHVYVRAHVSPGKDWNTLLRDALQVIHEKVFTKNNQK